MSRGFPSMTALLGLLAVAGYQNRDKIAEMLGGLTNPQGGQGGSSQPQGGLGNLGGLGGLLGGLAGAGAAQGQGSGGFLNGGLGELLESFKQNGQGDVADSWIGTGPNKEVAPPQLEQAIGPDVLDTLAQQTGLSREEILARLSRELPRAVDQYTPEGRIPTA
ncbi:YidB family protein [Microvirga zambiensis]|uniref:YidB family protein n=1 Tax=Microvirga zambiensis TaxID=1402137 RepID=UPI00191E68A4|nr:YidB family protein [Microvirga zambiensis]